jgi:hypothetical protein
MLVAGAVESGGRGRRGWVVSALAVTWLLSCSSDGPTSVDAVAPDAAADSGDAGESDAPADVAPDGHGGTVRGGTGGGRDSGVGGAGGAPVDAAGGDEVAPAAVSNDTCAAAQTLVLDRPRLQVAASTRTAAHDLDLGCGPSGGDVFFSFTLAERELVYADTFGASANTVLAFVDSCGDVDAGASGPPTCGDDACGTGQSQVSALLSVGTHYLVLGGEPGDVTIHFEHAPVGAGSVSSLGPGTATASGITSGIGRLALCEAGGPENSYWWTSCPAFPGGMFTASTCAGTVYDTILALQIPRTAALICDDDACRLQASISAALPAGAGLHVLSVDGFTGRQQGAYTVITNRP